MNAIRSYILKTEPLHPGSSIVKATYEDQSVAALYAGDEQLSQEAYSGFQKRMALIQKAATEYRAAIPKPLAWGLSPNDQLPFAEFEWIDGENLDQKIKNSGGKLPVAEVIHIAEDVSRILTICHNLDLVHGNLTTRSIIWNGEQGKYILAGFALGLNKKVRGTSDMEGTDIVSNKQLDIKALGAILLQLLTERATQKRSERENGKALDGFRSDVPAWLCSLTQSAISVVPSKRYSHVGELYQTILKHHAGVPAGPRRLRSKPQSAFKEKTPALFAAKGSFPKKSEDQKKRSLARTLIVTGVLAILCIGLIFSRGSSGIPDTRIADEFAAMDSVSLNTTGRVVEEKAPEVVVTPVVVGSKKKKSRSDKKESVRLVTADSSAAKSTETTPVSQELPSAAYKVRSKAYFHNEPNVSSRRRAFIVHWNNAVLHPLREEGGYVYVVFTNDEGQTSKGWLKKSDLIVVK